MDPVSRMNLGKFMDNRGLLTGILKITWTYHTKIQVYKALVNFFIPDGWQPTIHDLFVLYHRGIKIIIKKQLKIP